MAEENETLTVAFSELSSTDAPVDISDTATVTISDNDSGPALTIADIAVTEGTDATATVSVALDKEVTGGFTVNASTRDGGAAAGGDYTTVADRTLTFAGTAGETRNFTVPILDDTVFEPEETFTVFLGDLAGTALDVDISDTATVTIRDDESAALTIADVAVTEGTNVTATISVVLDRAVAGGFTVKASTAAGSATADSDYTAVTDRLLTFAGSRGETEHSRSRSSTIPCSSPRRPSRSPSPASPPPPTTSTSATPPR